MQGRWSKRLLVKIELRPRINLAKPAELAGATNMHFLAAGPTCTT